MATKLSKLQELISEENPSPTTEKRPASGNKSELHTIMEENKRLNELSKTKQEELRQIHTVKAHSQRPKTSTAAAAPSKNKIQGDVINFLNLISSILDERPDNR